MVGVQLLQVGGTAVCVDWLSTFGIQTTQLTLQDENGIYTLINSFYFFAREKGETEGGTCQLDYICISGTAQITQWWLMLAKS